MKIRKHPTIRGTTMGGKVKEKKTIFRPREIGVTRN